MREKYGEKVYKLPVNIPVSCPNRDGAIGTGGCSFCGEAGAGFENLPDTLSVMDQLVKNMKYIGKRYGAAKFTAYFQNFSNTYLPLEYLRRYMEEASSVEGIVEICISTRPDCVSDRYLSVIKDVSEASGCDVCIETRTSKLRSAYAEADKQGTWSCGVHRRSAAHTQLRL